jgi:hypothetical protein
MSDKKNEQFGELGNIAQQMGVTDEQLKKGEEVFNKLPKDKQDQLGKLGKGVLGKVEGDLGKVEGNLGKVEGNLGKVEGNLGKVEGDVEKTDKK